jgi:DNA-binding protein HU-beta
MTKAEFVKSVAQVKGLPQTQTEQILGIAFQVLTELLEAGEQVAWPGFGSFKVVDRAAREGRNPQTGAKIQIPASKAVKFSAAQGLRDQING